MKPRTISQNRALHKLFTDISRYCLEHGIDMKTVLDHMSRYRCQVSPGAVKETWRAIQITTLGKESTTELEAKEIDQVYEEFNKLWTEITHEHFPFPSYESLAQQALLDELSK